MASAQHITVDLRISADEWLRLYRGEVLNVSAVSRDGRRVQFPARILQSFVSHGGVRGSFRIDFDQNGKFQQITRLA